MSTFLILPARPILEEILEHALGACLPGTRFQSAGGVLADAVHDALSRQSDLYVLFREELPDDSNLPVILRDGFGAEPGDEVVELRLGAGRSVLACTWRCPRVSAA